MSEFQLQKKKENNNIAPICISNFVHSSTQHQYPQKNDAFDAPKYGKSVRKEKTADSCRIDDHVLDVKRLVVRLLDVAK